MSNRAVRRLERFFHSLDVTRGHPARAFDFPTLDKAIEEGYSLHVANIHYNPNGSVKVEQVYNDPETIKKSNK